MTAEHFPGAEFNMVGATMIPTSSTVQAAAAALARDTTPMHIREAASDVLNMWQTVKRDHPEYL